MGDREHLRGDTANVHGPIPAVVYEAVVQAAGSALHWREALFTILRTAGVKEQVVDEYRVSDLSKFQIAREVLRRRGSAGEPGWKVQRRLVAELANITKPDPKAPDQEAGREALEELKRLALDASLLVSPDELERRRARAEARAAAEDRSRRAEALASLHAQFNELHRSTDKQRRGYGLEKILASLFRLDELRYDTSYKTETDQIDGTVTIESFLYLVEARWRDAQAVEADLGGLQHKATVRMEATRGIFISMAGFRPEVATEWRKRPGSKLVFVDGQDMALIVEGRISIKDALIEKIHSAGRDGEPYLPLSTLL
jgi:hypothetical protein